MTFTEKLAASTAKHDSLLCVGLDPDVARFPLEFKDKPDAIFLFCKAIIAKRGDIGSTAEQYAREAFERYDADAVTLNPYMGFDSIAPYLEWKDRGAIILCRTSNPGGSDLQFLTVDGLPLYQHVARLVAKKWNQHGQCGLVVGATFPHELGQVRKIVGDMPLLVPGIGAQGGDIEATVKAGRSSSGAGMMINSSRAILYAKPEANEHFTEAASRVAQQTRDAINQFRHT